MKEGSPITRRQALLLAGSAFLTACSGKEGPQQTTNNPSGTQRAGETQTIMNNGSPTPDYSARSTISANPPARGISPTPGVRGTIVENPTVAATQRVDVTKTAEAQEKNRDIDLFQKSFINPTDPSVRQAVNDLSDIQHDRRKLPPFETYDYRPTKDSRWRFEREPHTNDDPAVNGPYDKVTIKFHLSPDGKLEYVVGDKHPDLTEMPYGKIDAGIRNNVQDDLLQGKRDVRQVDGVGLWHTNLGKFEFVVPLKDGGNITTVSVDPFTGNTSVYLYQRRTSNPTV